LLGGDFTVTMYASRNVAPASEGERCRKKRGREIGREEVDKGADNGSLDHKYCRGAGIPIATIATLHVLYVDMIPGILIHPIQSCKDSPSLGFIPSHPSLPLISPSLLPFPPSLTLNTTKTRLRVQGS